jgi:hypothetical protein
MRIVNLLLSWLNFLISLAYWYKVCNVGLGNKPKHPMSVMVAVAMLKSFSAMEWMKPNLKANGYLSYSCSLSGGRRFNNTARLREFLLRIATFVFLASITKCEFRTITLSCFSRLVAILSKFSWRVDLLELLKNGTPNSLSDAKLYKSTIAFSIFRGHWDLASVKWQAVHYKWRCSMLPIFLCTSLFWQKGHTFIISFAIAGIFFHSLGIFSCLSSF